MVMEKSLLAIILPAGKLFDRTYAEGIVPAAQECGHQIIRISTDLTEAKLPSTFDALQSATSIIADLTARNSHVMFLLGYSRALNKEVIYLTQHVEDFPFELNNAIVYGSDTTFLRSELTAYWAGQRRAQNNGAEDPRAKFLSIFGDLLQKHGYEHRGPVVQDDPKVFTLLEQEMDLPLVQDIARRARELNIRVRLM